MPTVQNVLLVLSLIIKALVLVLLSVIVHLATQNLAVPEKHANSTYTPIIIEMLPARRINLVPGKHIVSYSHRDFNQLQYKLKTCIERNPRCSITKNKDVSCPYSAEVLNMHLCFDEHKQIAGAAVGKIKLHRDLLQIYAL